MKKHFCLFVILSWFVGTLPAQGFLLHESSSRRVSVTFTPSLPEVQMLKGINGTYARLLMDGCTFSREVGRPELPVITKLVEAPLCDSVIVTVSGSRYRDYEASDIGLAADLYPVQRAYPKSHTGPVVFDKDESVYAADTFYSLPLASVMKAGVLRDVNLACLSVAPVAYNPVTRQVRIYSSIDVDITFVNADMPATREMKSRYGSPLFKAAGHSVINPTHACRSELETAPVKYLIVAHSMFNGNEDLQAFVNWKRRIGYLVEVAYTGDPGVGITKASIKNFIKSRYTEATADDPAPSFLLLVGDVEQIPSQNVTEGWESYVTDSYYANWTDDYLPDCYYGRFSAQNAAQLAPQIEKTLMYEQYTMPDPSYLGKACLIAGTDDSYSPTHANGQIRYISDNYINTVNGYSEVFTHYYNCSGEAASIRSEIGAGVGWANYTAHGSDKGWYNPKFENSHVQNMHNKDKYGVIIGNCCLSGQFDEASCFGETLLRTADKGAMGYIGASSSSYWDEDFYWSVGVRNNITANPVYNARHLGAYDKMNHLHGEEADDCYTTMGGMVHAGNLAVQSSNSDLKKYYWEIYHVFGDPSVRLYLSVPEPMSVEAADAIVAGSDSYSVAAAPYAYVALTRDNAVMASAFADGNGNATLALNQPAPGACELAVCAQNRIPFFKNVDITVPEGSFVIASEIDMTTPHPTPAATLKWDLTVKNIGVETAGGVSAEITTSRPDVDITQGAVQAGTLAADGIMSFTDAFTAVLPADAHDREVIPFTVTIHFDGNTNSHNLWVTVTAPKIEVTGFEATGPAQAPQIHAGDEVTVNITNLNSGHYNLADGIAELSTLYSGATVTSGPASISNLNPNQTLTTFYTIDVKDTVPEVTIVPVYYRIYSNGTLMQADTFNISVGSTTEDWESNGFAAHPWSNNGPNRWQIDGITKHSGYFSARSKEHLDDSRTSTLKITVTSNCDGIFSYYHKVSSESNYDKFSLYIDNEQKESLSGNEGWQKSEFFVPAGVHTYKFSYKKDPTVSIGNDCAWIDDITFPGLGDMAFEDLGSAGVDGHKTEAGFCLYPNPAVTTVTVAGPGPFRAVTVYDLGGRTVGRGLPDGSSAVTLNVAALSPGIYFVKGILADGRAVTRKLIKQ